MAVTYGLWWWANTPVAYTCGGQKSKDTHKCWSHTPAVGKSLRNAPKQWLHTPAESECLKAPNVTLLGKPWATPGCPLPPQRPSGIIKILQKWQKRPIIHLPHLIARPPGGKKKKRPCQSVPICPKIIPAKFRPNPSTFRATYT